MGTRAISTCPSAGDLDFAPTPGGMHWNAPTFGGGAATSVSIQMTGSTSLLTTTDSVWILLYSDGSSSGGSSF